MSEDEVHRFQAQKKRPESPTIAIADQAHQGIFYLRNYLLDHRYNTEYPAQADHKMYKDIVADRSLHFEDCTEPVVYFSAGGVSSLRPDVPFRRGFTTIMARAYGRYLGALFKLKQLAIDTFRGDPESRFQARLRR